MNVGNGPALPPGLLVPLHRGNYAAFSTGCFPGHITEELLQKAANQPLSIGNGRGNQMGLQMNGRRSIVVSASNQSVVFEGSTDECKTFADKVVVTDYGVDLYIYEPKMRVICERGTVKARHDSTAPRG